MDGRDVLAIFSRACEVQKYGAHRALTSVCVLISIPAVVALDSQSFCVWLVLQAYKRQKIVRVDQALVMDLVTWHTPVAIKN